MFVHNPLFLSHKSSLFSLINWSINFQSRMTGMCALYCTYLLMSCWSTSHLLFLHSIGKFRCSQATKFIRCACATHARSIWFHLLYHVLAHTILFVHNFDLVFFSFHFNPIDQFIFDFVFLHFYKSWYIFILYIVWGLFIWI